MQIYVLETELPVDISMATAAEGRTDKVKLDHATGHVSLQYLACGQDIQAAKSSVFLPLTHNSPRQSIFDTKCVFILPNNRCYGRGIN